MHECPQTWRAEALVKWRAEALEERRAEALVRKRAEALLTKWVDQGPLAPRGEEYPSRVDLFSSVVVAIA